MLERDGTVVEPVDSKPLDDLAPPTNDDLKEVNQTDAICLIPRTGNIFRAALALEAHQGRVLFVARAVDPRAREFPPLAQAGVAYYQALAQKKLGIQVPL